MHQPLRVLTIGHAYVLSVNRAVMRELAKDEGFSVTAIAPKFFQGDLRPLALQAEPENSQLHLVGVDVRWSSRIHVFHYDPGQLREILNRGFDIVHIWEEPYVFAGFQTMRLVSQIRLGTRGSNGSKHPRLCFATLQNIDKRYPPPFSFFERSCLKAADAWLANGKAVYDVVVKRGYNSHLGRVIPLPVDTDLFRVLCPMERVEVLTELKLRPPVIAFVGRLTPEKGIEVLLRALELLPVDGSWSALFLGSGPEEKNILNWANSRRLSDRVRVFLAKHDEVPRYLGAADLLAAPSQTTKRWKEQFGRMLIEAFACGVPVLGSDSGEIPNVIGDAGRVLPEKDPAAWAAAIAELLGNPAERAAMARRGLERAVQFSAKALAVQYREFYRWLAAR